MRLFLIFMISFAISCGTSYLAYKLFNIDISPPVVSIALLASFMMLPNKWVNKINGN